MRDLYHVCYIVDQEYHSLALKSINSAKKVSKKHINFYIIGDIKNKKQGINYISPPEYMNNLHIVDWYANLPEIMINYGIKKCLYLDADTIVCKCLSRLIDTDMDRFCVAGVQHPKQKNCIDLLRRAKKIDEGDLLKNFKRDLYYEKCINAGVVLFNNQEYVKQRCFEKYIHLKEKSKLPFPGDETYFNLTVAGKIKFVDKRWNVCGIHSLGTWQRPYIMHFLDKSPNKPNHTSSYH